MKSFRELGRLAHASGELRLFGVFQAFLDESGIHQGARVLSIAGYLAPEKEWIRFIPKWQQVLDTKNIHVFHAKDCNSSENEFRQFKGKRQERNEFVAKLLKTVGERSRIVPFMAALLVDDYTDPIREWMTGEAKHPFYACFQSMMSQIGVHMEKAQHPRTERVHLVYDRQAQFSKHALFIFNEWKDNASWRHAHWFKGLDFESKEDQIPLQLADALAFDTAKEIEREYFSPERRPRPSFAVLSKGIRPFIWDHKTMTEFKMQYERVTS